MPAMKSTLRILANLVVALATPLGTGAQKDKGMEQPVLYRTVRSMASTSFTEKQGQEMRRPFSYCMVFRRRRACFSLC
jgi:hypothetical protein